MNLLDFAANKEAAAIIRRALSKDYFQIELPEQVAVQVFDDQTVQVDANDIFRAIESKGYIPFKPLRLKAVKDVVYHLASYAKIIVREAA